MSATTLSPKIPITVDVTPKRTPRHKTRRFLWTVKNYHRAIEAGVFDEDPHVELFNGELVRTMPENPPHAMALKLVEHTLARTFHMENAHIFAPVTSK